MATAPPNVKLLTTRCQAILEDSDTREEHKEWANNQRARLNIWANTLGVFAHGRLSVEHRLRLNIPIHKLIWQLLDAVVSSLELCMARHGHHVVAYVDHC